MPPAGAPEGAALTYRTILDHGKARNLRGIVLEIVHPFYHCRNAGMDEGPSFLHGRSAAGRRDRLPAAGEIGDVNVNPVFRDAVLQMGVETIDTRLITDRVARDIAGLPVNDDETVAVTKQHVGNGENPNGLSKARDARKIKRLKGFIDFED